MKVFLISTIVYLIGLCLVMLFTGRIDSATGVAYFTGWIVAHAAVVIAAGRR